MTWSRRDFLSLSAAAAAGLAATRLPVFAGDEAGYGPLVRDEGGVMDLPAGFRYTVFSRKNDPMSDGLATPAAHDGMAAFPGPEGKTILIRNHEQSLRGWNPFGRYAEKLDDAKRALLYDEGTIKEEKGRQRRRAALGGTTTLVFDTKTQKLEASWLSLGGTMRNCAGGPTPWGSWLTCEEDTSLAGKGFSANHGWVFEVPATHEPKLHKAVPIKPMGRFNREACAVDPKTGAVYMTEDRIDGLLYRYLPKVKGKLAEGGQLQALTLVHRKTRLTANHPGSDPIPVGQDLDVAWIDLQDVEAPKDDLRVRGAAAGAAVFCRGEGLWWGHGGAFFTCTAGGPNLRGQVWRYTPDAQDPAKGKLRLLVEPNDEKMFDMVDNICVAPWGDLYCCEDGSNGNGLVGITPAGRAYRFAWNRMNSSELTGVCGSPDGTTLFVNIQRPGLTLAITGPWKSPNGKREF